MEKENGKERDYDTLLRRYESSQLSLDHFSRENDELRARVALLEAEKGQWVQSKGMQEIIIQQTLDQANSLNNELSSEVDRLTKEVIELKGRIKELEGE